MTKKEIEQLKKNIFAADENGRLLPEQLSIIYEKKWFKLFVPKKYGGLQLALPKALRLQEQLAYIDGSLGWTITLCAGANLFAGYIEKNTAQKIFINEKICMGGSGAVGGTAEKINGGYIINGHWKYATGAPHLTHFTANCTILQNGKPLLDVSGEPVVQSFFFNKKEVIVYKDWNTMGLKATAGHSFSIKNLMVPENRSFIIHAASATHDDLIYQYPFITFAEATLAVNNVGMALHFLDEALQIIKNRRAKQTADALKIDQSYKKVTSVKTDIEKLRAKFYALADASWREIMSNGNVSKKTQQQIATTSRALVMQCRQGVAAVYPYCGLAATLQGSMLNLIFRDVFTASQHSLLTYK